MTERHDSNAAATGEAAEWIKWDGGKQPVADKVKVNLRTIDPDWHSDDNYVFLARDVHWDIRGEDSDVKEYRIVSAGAA